jgi:hypothetical protein
MGPFVYAREEATPNDTRTAAPNYAHATGVEED